MNTNLTSEEKLDAIYMMLRSNQARLKRAFWYRIFKWCLIIGVAYFTLTHPGYIAGKVTQYLQPILMEQMKTIIANQKEGFFDKIQKMLPEQQSQ